MAFTTILRRSISSVLPLAVRAAQRNHHRSALFTALYHSSFSHKPSPRPFASTLHFYSSSAAKPSSDATLIRVIESEIKFAEESDDHEAVEEVPGGFPFEIQDVPGYQIINLSRKYEGEVIKVEVHMPDLVTGEDNNNDDDQGGDNEKANQSSIPLVVTVSKEDGPTLEFGCTAFPDEITIDSLLVKYPEASEDEIPYEGPDFQDLDENLQKAFHKYLEIRGIKPSTTNFLHEYMINKDSREYLLWLKNLRKFVVA